MSRAPRADDLYALRAPVEVQLSPDGRQVVYCLKETAPDKDGYRQSLWLVPADGSAPPRQLTLGRKKDTSPRWSPDGRTVAFLSDRGAVLDAGEGSDVPKPLDETEKSKPGGTQVWLLPMDGGEARQLTRLPEDVGGVAWSPDGKRLCIVSAATEAEPKPKRR
ncbi:MAG: hypothetical protein M3395_06440, partial [Chloroflexota bacterium]|nr:hypothetical protein [Chloroflexota bacterium]